MLEKSKGKLVTSAISIAAAALLCLGSFISFITQSVYLANYGGGFIGFSNVYMHFMLFSGGAALLSLGVYGLFKFTDKGSRKVGKASVITYLAARGVLLLSLIIQMIKYGAFILDVGLIIDIIIGVGLIVAFFVCDKKFPVGETGEIVYANSAPAAAAVPEEKPEETDETDK